jgi:hypothetical protein
MIDAPRRRRAWSTSCRREAQEVLDVHESPDVVEIPFVHHHPAAPRSVGLCCRHLHRDVSCHRDDVAARRHRIGRVRPDNSNERVSRACSSAASAPWPAGLVEQQLEFGR